MSRRNATRGSRGSQPLSARRRAFSAEAAGAASATAGDKPYAPRLSGAVIVGEDAVACTGLLALMQSRYPGLPFSLCQDVREAHRQAARSPGCLVIAVLCFRPEGLITRLRELLWLRRQTRQQPWMLLYDSLAGTLPGRLSGMQVLPLRTPFVGIQKALDQMMYRCPPVAMRLCPLTYRQWAVLRLLARGCRPAEVGVMLGITEKTVSIHRMDTLRRLALCRHHERLLFCVVRAMFPDRATADEGLTRHGGGCAATGETR